MLLPIHQTEMARGLLPGRSWPVIGETMLLGAHVGTAGGFSNAVKAGKEIRADIIQIFTRNQMQWRAKPIDEADAEKFRSDFAASKLKGVIAHGSYLINLASPEKKLRKMSVEAVVEEVTRCSQLGIGTYIFHPGSHVGSGDKKGEKREAESLREVISRTAKLPVKLALENMAGQGNVICHDFGAIAGVIEMTGSERLGVCIDTCHLFASGYDIRDRKSLAATMKEFKAEIGMKKLLAFHLNDSKGELGCRLDRHENIGKGKIGIEGFRALMHYPGLSRIPMALETPGGKNYKQEIALLRKL